MVDVDHAGHTGPSGQCDHGWADVLDPVDALVTLRVGEDDRGVVAFGDAYRRGERLEDGCVHRCDSEVVLFGPRQGL